MANLTKEVAKRIILSREIVTGQHTQSVDLTVSSVNLHDGKYIVNFKGATEKQYANAITLFRNDDIEGAANQCLSMGVFADAKFIPTAGMMVNVTLKSVKCRDESFDLRPQGIARIAAAQTFRGDADDFDDAE